MIGLAGEKGGPNRETEGVGELPCIDSVFVGEGGLTLRQDVFGRDALFHKNGGEKISLGGKFPAAVFFRRPGSAIDRIENAVAARRDQKRGVTLMEKLCSVQGDLSAGAAGNEDHVRRFRFIFYKDKICNGIKKMHKKNSCYLL